MKIGVKVKVRSSRNDVVKNSGGAYTVFLKSAPVEGKANEELIEILSEKFGIAKNALRIVKGTHSKNKVIEIIHLRGVERTLRRCK